MTALFTVFAYMASPALPGQLLPASEAQAPPSSA
jgi:hypothetical protein